MKTALVTGGAGFIGSHLVRALVAQQVRVRILDNLSSGNLSNLYEHPNGHLNAHLNGDINGYGGKPLRKQDRQIEFVEGDIRNAVACNNACRDIDVVFHMAALVSVPQSVNDPIQSDAINSGGTLNLLIAARDRQVKRFIFSSSAAVYGNTEVIPTDEEVLPAPLSPYGVQKLTGESYARLFAHLYGLETVCLRYFNVYGPGQNPKSAYAAAIPRFLTTLLRDESPTIFGDGEQTRDFCAVGDVVAANILAATTQNPQAIGNVFNIAGGTRVSLNTLLHQMQDVTGKHVSLRYDAPRMGDIRHSGADIRRARTYLEYSPAIDLNAGLRCAAEYYADLR